MTVLAPKADRDALGIDTIYRGFVYGALLLAKAIKDPLNPVPLNQNPFALSSRISGLNHSNGTFTLEVTLPVNRIGYYETAFDLIDNVGIVGTTDPNPFDQSSPSTNNNVSQIPTQPSNVTTLEGYVTWLALNIQLAYASLETPNFTNMTVTYQDENLFDNATGKVIIRNIAIYDPIIYLCTNNIIQALTQPAELPLC